MHKLKAGLNADKFATFWMLPKSFYHSFFLQMTFIHSTTGWTQVDLRDFEKKKKTCESVKRNAVISKTTFTKTAIKSKFVASFSLKISEPQLISVLKNPRISCPLKTF